ncbi:MAG: hypothetical protein V4772_24510 [Pseudomonadota bacterium]
MAQTPTIALPEASRQATADAERTRISAERARLEAGFTNENAACYKIFFVNNCLEEVKNRQRDALADLRRQEVLLNEQDRKSKAAEQVRKTEERSSPEKQQQEADKRAEALKNFQSRAEREKQKDADRVTTQANEKTYSEATANRLKNSQNKANARSEKQAAAAEKVKQLNERQQKAKERQARHARDELARTKTPSKPLPVPP